VSDAKPMDPNMRVMSYFKGSDRWDTPAQRRRRRRKLGHLASLERKLGYTHGLIKGQERKEESK
jgi:hypothetical protein